MTFRNTLTEIRNHQNAILELENQAIELLKASKKVGVCPVKDRSNKIIGYNAEFLDEPEISLIAFADTERGAWLEAVYCCDGVSTFSID